MQHTRFLRQKRVVLEQQMLDLKHAIADLETRRDFIDELLEEAAADDGVASDGADAAPLQKKPLRDLIIDILSGVPGNELTLHEIIETARTQGHAINKLSLQSTLSRNRDCFDSVDSRAGRWSLKSKLAPKGLGLRERAVMKSLDAEDAARQRVSSAPTDPFSGASAATLGSVTVTPTATGTTKVSGASDDDPEEEEEDIFCLAVSMFGSAAVSGKSSKTEVSDGSIPAVDDFDDADPFGDS